MNNLTVPFSLFAILFTGTLPATASIIDVTNDSQVTVDTGESLIFYISSGYSSGGHGSSYPGEIQMLLGGMPLGGPVASIPGTSGVYLTGFLFIGELESQDGSISIPLTDSDATRLNLPNGDMLLTPGSRSGGSYSGAIDLVSADATVGAQQDAALFGSGEVQIDIKNIGADYTFGYPGSAIASDFSASLFNQDCSQSVGAQVLKVDLVNAPEPGTVGLLILGLTIIATRLGRMRAAERK
ncbi:MAG: hypothetical protein ABSG65_30395 [Bryobacteraceae bacterium]|jgi:hypothetical protein